MKSKFTEEQRRLRMISVYGTEKPDFKERKAVGYTVPKQALGLTPILRWL